VQSLYRVHLNDFVALKDILTKYHVFSTSTIPIGAQVEFQFLCSKEQGAILALSDDADCQDALQTGIFIKTIHKNYHDWLKHLKERNFCLNLDELLLVTGWDKAASWSNTVLKEGQRECEIRIGINPTPITEASIGGRISLEPPGSRYIEENWGPPK